MTTNALNPLPSFLRASAQDAAKRSCYGRPGDHNQPDYCFIRFQHAPR